MKIVRFSVGALLFILGFFITLPMLKLAVFVAAYLIVGGEVVYRAVRNIFAGEFFDENFLMSIATIGAFILGEYPEGVAVMLFYQLGELFLDHAIDNSRRSISSLMDIRPDYANVKHGESIVKTTVDQVKVDDLIVIKAGERIPLDCVIVNGVTTVDTSALTGESVPRDAGEGCALLSGCININGMITARVTNEFAESAVCRILDLVENAAMNKAKTENFVTQFAHYYTPIVIILAAIISCVPPIIMGGQGFGEWTYRGLTFLVISCPCALVLSIPMGFFGGIGGASKRGILVKGGNFLEALANTEIVVFDKTGTLTKGVFKVAQIQPVNMTADHLLQVVAHAQGFSNHPIAVSLREAFDGEIDTQKVSEVEEIPGCGVRAVVDGNHVAVGNSRLMRQLNIDFPPVTPVGTIVHAAVNNEYAGYIVIADQIKSDAADAISALKSANVSKTVMLTGDVKTVGESVGAQLGIDLVYTDLLPAGKVEKVEWLLSQKAKGKLAFVGDGINDAPVLARADVGIAMGGLGADAAIEAADVVIMTDEPSKIAEAIRIARRTIGIVRQNIVMSIAVKVAILILASIGFAGMWGGVVADVGVAVAAILNSIRAARGTRKVCEVHSA